ncbi:Protocadherin-11 X-linked, partial [Plecturocebus cupreus]
MLASIVSISGPRDLPASAFQSAGITGVSHCARRHMHIFKNAHVQLCTCVVFQSGAQEKNYTIREEMPENVLIGDLLKDLNLSLVPDKSLTSPMQFKLVYKTGDVPLIRIEEGTGEIFTTGARIDREKLCAGISMDTQCFYEVEVAVLPDEIFRLVKIRFLIEDINDNAPLFPATVINISIPENSAINSRYALPAAIDPDVGINGVQNYHLIKNLALSPRLECSGSLQPPPPRF